MTLDTPHMKRKTCCPEQKSNPRPHPRGNHAGNVANTQAIPQDVFTPN